MNRRKSFFALAALLISAVALPAEARGYRSSTHGSSGGSHHRGGGGGCGSRGGAGYRKPNGKCAGRNE